MKKIVNITMFIMLVLFGLGLGTTAAATNWTAFCWVITGLLWFLFYWFSKIEYETTIDEKEGQLKDLRKNRDDYMGLYKHYWDKYDEKLKQNLELAEENVSLSKELQAAKNEIIRLSKDNNGKEQKPAEWSEEDNRMLRAALECLDYISCESKIPVVIWLKSLRSRYSRKTGNKIDNE